MSVPVSYMIPDSLPALHQLHRRVFDERQKRLEELRAAASWDDFQHRTGLIRGLDIAMEIAAEIVKQRV